VGGDILVDKRDSRGLVRPAQTVNAGYLMISIAVAISDPYVRRRVHSLVAYAFLGPPPAPSSIIEHLDDNPQNRDLINLLYSTSATNRARRNGTAKFTPAGKVRPLPLDLRLVRRVQAKTGHKGQRLTKYVEELLRKDLKKKAA
jgi:HNH endonuclease